MKKTVTVIEEAVIDQDGLKALVAEKLQCEVEEVWFKGGWVGNAPTSYRAGYTRRKEVESND